MGKMGRRQVVCSEDRGFRVGGVCINADYRWNNDQFI